jgi:transcriptional regulator with XRE-family HTH domain
MKKLQQLRTKLGTVLREQREKAGLSQIEVTSHFDYHVQFLSNIERGVSAIPDRFLAELAKYYKCEEDILTLLVDATHNHYKKLLGVKGDRYAAAYGRSTWPKQYKRRSD